LVLPNQYSSAACTPRAAIGLLEQAGAKLPGKDGKQLKKAAKALSRLRDSAAMIESLDRVRRRYPKRLPEQIDRLAARMRQPLRRRAFTLGRRVHSRTPSAFARWFRGASMKQPPSRTAAA
jgi:hypothetical protein